MGWLQTIFKKQEDTNADLSPEQIINLNQLGYNDTKQYLSPTEQQVLQKGMKGKDKAEHEPYLGSIDMGSEYKEVPNISGGHTRQMYEQLKHYANVSGIINAIINTRLNQISLYCRPARYDDRGMGFEIKMKDADEKPRKADLQRMNEIEDFIFNTGKDKKDWTRDAFPDFMKKIARDRLTYDKINFELTYDKAGNLHHFDAVDASTFFVYAEEGKETKGKDDIKYVQVLDDKVMGYFTAKELAWEVQHPRSDVKVGQYGKPELEQVLKYLVFHETTENYNSRYFSQGGTTKGLLHVKTGAQQTQQALGDFRREWNSTANGIRGSWKIPVVTAEEIKYVNMNQSMRDMEKR